jgi:hypothetical protein
LDDATVYIYGLRHPDGGDVRYVGRTRDPKQRLKFHWTDRRYSNRLQKKADWLRSLDSEGCRPVIEVLDEVSAATCHADEQAWIDWLLSEGHDLTNEYVGSTKSVGLHEGYEPQQGPMSIPACAAVIESAVRKAAEEAWTISELAAQLGVSKQTARKYVHRYGGVVVRHIWFPDVEGETCR